MTAISTSGYFSPVNTLMKTGDIILINASNGTAIKSLTVAEGVVSVAALS